MASLITVRLNKADSTNWGFRLQGGKDFGTPLVIQKVNGGSPAERAGLIAGDAVIKINNTDVFNLRHKDAQDVVVRSGASFDMTIQRGGSTWKPSVTPITTPTPSINSIAPVTKTSLASTKKENIGAIGTGHNTAAKPFNTQINGTVNGGPGPKVVNNQYNSPLKLYSEESIAETLSAQTEVLAPGVLGVNFKKNERNYDAANSAVFRMVQEAEKEPKIPEPEPDSGVVATPAAVQGLKHVTAPETKPTPTTPQLPPGQNVCADCERLIVGVFVRIKDKNLHVECFKCATCGTSLKNVGYYNVNNKLYCDIHAKLAALSNPTLSPTASVPLGKAPASAISSALSSHSIPSPSPLSPKPNSSATPFQVGNPFSPKPFSSVSAPTYKPISNSAALSPVSSIPAPNYSPVSSTGHSVQNIVWPPPQEEPEVPTACPLYFPPPSQVQVTSKRQRFDSCDNTESEVDMTEFQGSYSGFAQASGRISTVEECIETISETLNTQQLVENVLKNKLPPQSTTPPQIDKNDKSLGSKQELQLKQLTESDTNQAEGTCDLKRPVEFNPVIKQKPICAKKIDNSVPKQWESQMVQALKTIPDDDNSDPFTQIPTKRSSSALASALATAPAQPFTPYNVTLNPIPLPEETVPYFPPEHPITSVKPSDPPSEATFKKKKNPTDKFLSDLPKPQEKLTMLSALTTAPDRSYSPFTVTTTVQEESEVTEKSDSSKTETIIEKKTLQRPLKPTKLPPSFTQIVTENDPKALGCYPLFKGFSCSFENNSDLSQFKIEISTTPPIPNNPEEIDHDCFNGVESETVETVQTERVVEESQSSSSQIEKREKVEVIAKQSEDVILKKAEPLLALHKAGQLPQYQKNLSETVEADLQLMKKIEAANLRHQQQKIECTTSDFECKEVERITKPTITLHPGNAQPEVIFKPVDDEVKAQNLSFSPRPRPLTPSMINKPAPAIPYYQASLVTQQYRAPTINLLDPTSPAVSRSPSPCHERRSPSPFPNKESSIRPKSPAAGPPPNPLHSSKPLPTPRDSKMEEVKRNVSAYIPQYRSKIDGAITSQISNNSMQKKATNLQVQQFQNLQVEESNRNQVFREESKGLSSTVAISEQSHAEHLEAMKQSQCQSVENRGNVQVQRKKTVTEEFEHSQKSKVIQIEKNTTQNHAFRNINCNAITEQGVVGLHVTNPQPIVSPFLHNKPKPQAVCPESKSTDPKSCQERKSSCPNVCHIDVTLPKPPERKPCPKLDPKPSPAKPACFKPVVAPSGSSLKPNQSSVNRPNVPVPNAGAGGGRQAGAVGVAPKRGRGVLNAANLGGARVPLCGQCHSQIRYTTIYV